MSTPAEKAMKRWLIETFPKTFFDKGSERPLKIGILEDVQLYLREHPQPDVFPVEDKSVRLTVWRYVRNITYLRSMVAAGEGSPRVDLTGNEDGHVTQEQLAWTVQRIATLDRRAEIRAAKKAAAVLRRTRARSPSQDESSRSRPPSAEQSSATN